MRATVVGVVTPHLLNIVDLANQAEKGVNVDWHVRQSVSSTLSAFRGQYNESALVASYVEGLETAVSQAPASRPDYARVMQAAAAAARNPGRY